MLERRDVTRAFKFGNRTLPDPNPKLSPAQIKDHYAALYPELTSAAIEGPQLKHGKQLYILATQAGTKG